MTAEGTHECGSCHADIQTAWEGSHHARAERIPGPSDDWAPGAVRILGVEPLEQAVYEREGRWWVDPVARDVRDGSRFSVSPAWMGHRPSEDGFTWNSQCAECHNTGVSVGLRTTGTYETTVEAVGITCEACHGPQQRHREGGEANTHSRMEDVCLSCHTRRVSLTDRFRPGDAFLDHFLPATVADPDFGVEARALGEVFVGNAFLASPMHSGGARCVSCHDPHSGNLLAEGDAVCTSCHETHGPSDCVACHMPIRTVMARDDRRDHAFIRTVPSERRRRFEAIRSGALVEDLDLAGWPSGQHAAMLEVLSGRPDGRAAVREGMTHPDPWVRMAAAGALVPTNEADVGLLRTAAADRVRAVRVHAQRQLARAGGRTSGFEDLSMFYRLHADQADVLAERGLIEARQGRPEGLDALRRARGMEPNVVQWWVWSGIAHASMNQPAAAVEVLTEALTIHEEHPELLFARALARGQVGDVDGARSDLDATLRIAPAHEGARRNRARLTPLIPKSDGSR